jgi:hypothetical protein
MRPFTRNEFLENGIDGFGFARLGGRDDNGPNINWGGHPIEQLQNPIGWNITWWSQKQGNA